MNGTQGDGSSVLTKADISILTNNPPCVDRRIVTEFRKTFYHSKKGFLRFASYLFFSIEEKEREKVVLLYREKR